MKQEIIWEEIAAKRKWCAAERWRKALDKNAQPVEQQPELTLQEKRRQISLKARDTLLAKNPNYYKELSVIGNKSKTG